MKPEPLPITLFPINSRFKRLIHDFGSEWVMVGSVRAMSCFNGQLGITCHPVGNPKKLSNFKVWDLAKEDRRC